jgi:hypothetical protein
VALASESGRPEDAAINVWHFWSLPDDPQDAVEDINANVQTFYSSIEGLYCANTITGEFHLKMYDLADPEPRAVIAEYDGATLSPTTGDGLPTECAVCLSFGGAPGSGLNAKRRNGRLYIGPLSNGVTSTIDGSVIVSAPTVTALVDAAVGVIGYPTITHAWSVFSPTAAGAQPWDEATLEAATTFVTRGFVNNSFDTQRRRGTVETGRTNF